MTLTKVVLSVAESDWSPLKMLQTQVCCHSEAKKTLMFGTDKDLLQGPFKENQDPCGSKKPELSNSFQGMVFNSKIWGEGCRVCDFLLIGR